MQYIVMISTTDNPYTERTVFGPFKDVEEIKKWLENKYDNSEYVIDIFPVKYPYN
jgi:hypothetical protein